MKDNASELPRVKVSVVKVKINSHNKATEKYRSICCCQLEIAFACQQIRFLFPNGAVLLLDKVVTTSVARGAPF